VWWQAAALAYNVGRGLRTLALPAAFIAGLERLRSLPRFA